MAEIPELALKIVGVLPFALIEIKSIATVEDDGEMTDVELKIEVGGGLDNDGLKELLQLMVANLDSIIVIDGASDDDD